MQQQSTTIQPIPFVAAWLTGVATCSAVLLGWLSLDDDGAYLAQFAWLLVGGVIWLVRAGSLGPASNPSKQPALVAEVLQSSPRWIDVAAITGIGWIAVAAAGWSQADLPPAFHDEYSYRLEAELIASGRWTGPLPPCDRDLFEQMHVLTEHGRASRYYPGTALWLAPFTRIGFPLGGSWLAFGLSCGAISLLANGCGGRIAGRIAGLLAISSPGLLTFHQLLLSHAPTQLALLLFYYCVSRWFQSKRLRWAVAASSGLACAMLCRPGTAAAVAFPVGIYIVIRWVRGLPAERSGWTRIASECCGWLLPLAIGWGLMATYNVATTGHWLQSPYQLYTQLYTPRHVFGFNNAVAAAPPARPVFSAYNAWAENLTLSTAIEKSELRLLGSWMHGWNLVLAAMLATITALGWRQLCRLERLLLLSIAALHLLHVPYWYQGIMNFHYVFESVSLWLVLAGCVVARLANAWTGSGAWLQRGWLACGLILAAAINLTNGGGLWRGRLLMAELGEIRYSRAKQEELRREVTAAAHGTQVIVLVKAAPGNISLDYVVNGADWSAQILIARWPESEAAAVASRLKSLRECFTARRLFVFDESRRTLEEM